VPKKPDRLPYKIVKLATDMFARATGFSGPEIHNIFAEHTDALGPYSGGGGGPSRWQMFETGLHSLRLDDQRRFLLDLCNYDGYSKYPMPADEDIAKLRALLLADTSPGATAAADRLNKLRCGTVSATHTDAASVRSGQLHGTRSWR
jgi:hypothetical protein